jgi:hypothetical protein
LAVTPPLGNRQCVTRGKRQIRQSARIGHYILRLMGTSFVFAFAAV